ncbi:MAG: hypothetical protein ACTIDE_10060 [Carnobacterium maltaromaticum]
MTIGVCWVRKKGNSEELIVASDSRLCGGHRWDQCPKIITFPRGDCFLSFAGTANYAYPLMMQIYFSSLMTEKVRDRAIDVTVFNTLVLEGINNLQSSIFDEVSPEDIKENEFIFGGYSSEKKKYCLWIYKFNPGEKRFQKNEIKGKFLNIGKIAIVGDVKSEYKKQLYKYISSENSYVDKEYFELEPLQILINMLRVSNNTSTIGGAPQIVKIYQHLQARPIGVYWPKKEEDLKLNRTLIGRRLSTDENSSFSFLNPQTLQTNRLPIW